MMEEDVIAAYRLAEPPLPTNLVSRSSTKIHNISDDGGLAHVHSATNEIKPVLNSTTPNQQKEISAINHLFLFNNSIWVEHQSKDQREFVKAYFDKTFAQFNLNEKGNAFCPVIYSLKDFSSPTGKRILLGRVKEKRFVTISIFDLDYNRDSPNLVEYPIAPGLSLLDLTKEILADGDTHLIVALFSKKYDGTNLNEVKYHVDQFWDQEQRINFIFPTSPYSPDSLFSFEFGTLAEVLKNMANDYELCTDVLVDAQAEIAKRYQEIENLPNPEISSVCSSSFVYFNRATLKHQASDVARFDHGDSTKVRILSAIPALAELAEHHPSGFDKAACQIVEDIMTKICNKSLNFLNQLAHNSQFGDRDVLFAIALSMFDYLAERTDPLADEQVVQLYDMYKQGEAPFPNHLFRYMSRPDLGRPAIALSKQFQTFHQTTKWQADSPSYTKRTLHYLGILRGNPVQYRPIRTALTDLIGMAKRVETDDEFKQCLGFEIHEGRACYPHGMFLLDEKFTKIANGLVHKFHVVHNKELAHIAVNGKAPRTDLWVGSDENYFMTATVVNKGLGGFGDYFDSVRHPAPFGRCVHMVQEHELIEPDWLKQNWKWHKEEVGA